MVLPSHHNDTLAGDEVGQDESRPLEKYTTCYVSQTQQPPSQRANSPSRRHGRQQCSESL